MALESGRPPLRLLDEGNPDSWNPIDLEVVAQWRHLKEVKCPGCSRPLAQHLYNSKLGREETIEDYMPYSVDCPAQQAIAEGQQMWKSENKTAIESHQKGNGPDPQLGLFWLAKGHGEKLPVPEPTDH